MLNFLRSYPLLLLPLLILTGCGANPPTPAIQAETAAQAESTPATPHKGSFEPATLYSLLVAELAAQRGLPRVTLHNYLQETERTRDLGIARHTATIADQLHDTETLLRSALVWSELEPSNPEPYRIAAAELIKRGDSERALPLLETALRLNDPALIDALTERTDKMAPEEHQAYLQLLDKLLAEQPQNASLLYSKATLLRLEDDLQPALQLAQEALNQDPSYDRAILLEADLQARSGHLDTALSHLREELSQRNHKQMRTLYVRLLLEKQQFPLAEAQAQQLIDNNPGDHNLKFYIATLLLEHGRLDRAETYFNQLHQQLGSNSPLQYYLGRIAQQRGERDKALTHYTRVDRAPYLLPSQAEIARLLDQPSDYAQLEQIFSTLRQRNPATSATLFALEASWLTDKELKPQAMQVYNQALEQFPDDTRLRYNRAMLGEQLDDLPLLESDLRHLLQLEPDNAMALNALGYSLTEHTTRHQEALQLISKALELKPDDPAILDSMGWVHFQLGRPRHALPYLQRAYDSFPDPEIATHLGKVYWALGQTEQALKVWQEALQRDPDSQMLRDALAEARPASQP